MVFGVASNGFIISATHVSEYADAKRIGPRRSPALPLTTSIAQAEFHPDARPSDIPDEDQISFTPSTSGTTERLSFMVAQIQICRLSQWTALPTPWAPTGR